MPSPTKRLAVTLLSASYAACALACAPEDAAPPRAPSTGPVSTGSPAAASGPSTQAPALPPGFVALTGTPFAAAVPATATVKKGGENRSEILLRAGIDPVIIRLRDPDVDGATAADFEKFIKSIDASTKVEFTSKSADGKYFTYVHNQQGHGTYQRYFQVGTADVVCMVPTATDADLLIAKSICESVRAKP